MIEFHELALEEVREAQAWYAERSPAAAAKFRLALDRAVEGIVRSPDRFPKIHSHFRYACVFGFPYIITYRQRQHDVPMVMAVAHTSRQSNYWIDRE